MNPRSTSERRIVEGCMPRPETATSSWAHRDAMTKSDVKDARSCERFLIEPPIEGSFGGSVITIVDLAKLGLRTEHPSPVRPGTAGTVSFLIPGSEKPIQVRAEVVWSRLSQKPSPEGKLLYLSGLRLDADDESLSQAIQHLIRLENAHPDRESLERKRSKQEKAKVRHPKGTARVKVIRQHRRIDEDTLLLVKQAWIYMKHNPVQAMKWYNRAKYSLKEKESPVLHHKDDVLAIWEYLERMISLETIDWVLDNEHLV